MSLVMDEIRELRAISPPPEEMINAPAWPTASLDAFIESSDQTIPGFVIRSAITLIDETDLRPISGLLRYEALDGSIPYAALKKLQVIRYSLAVARDGIKLTSAAGAEGIQDLRAITHYLGRFIDDRIKGIDTTDVADSVLEAVAGYTKPVDFVPAPRKKIINRWHKRGKHISTLLSDVDPLDTEHYHNARRKFRALSYCSALAMLHLDHTEERRRLYAEGQLLNKRFGEKHGAALDQIN